MTDNTLPARAIVYIPTKSAMSSGIAKYNRWKVKFLDAKTYTDPIMGWQGSYASTDSSQLEGVLYFDTLEDAKKFLDERKVEYQIEEPNSDESVSPGLFSYLDNFKKF